MPHDADGVVAVMVPVVHPRRLSDKLRPFFRADALGWYVAALLIVLIRCAPSLWFEQFDFDSDQAIVGLMAKHLAEGRTFPLFFYGQNYMLGVEAWIAAPFVWAGGATVAM